MRLEQLARELAEICLAECLLPDCPCARCRKAQEVRDEVQRLNPQITQISLIKTEIWALCVECRAPVGKDERLCWACDQAVRGMANKESGVGEIPKIISVSEMLAQGWSVGIDTAKGVATFDFNKGEQL